MRRFIIKKISRRNSKRVISSIPKEVVSENNTQKKENVVMNTKEKIEKAAEILAQQNDNREKSFKKIKKEKGLIERTESSKTILIEEDNRELLKD
jgi:hypothetical protein